MERITVVLPFSDRDGSPVSATFEADKWATTGRDTDREKGLVLTNGTTQVAQFEPGRWLAVHNTDANKSTTTMEFRDVLRGHEDHDHEVRTTQPVVISGEDPVSDLTRVFSAILDQICPTYLVTRKGEDSALVTISSPAGVIKVAIDAEYADDDTESEPTGKHHAEPVQ